MQKLVTAVILTCFALFRKVQAHGRVLKYEIGGVVFPSFEADDISLPADQEPITAGWSVPEGRYIGGITGEFYQHPDIICSRAATPGGTHTPIVAGQSITLFWMAFDRTHHGPVITYLANCHGPCETIDKTALEFFKIEEVGLITPNVPVGPGTPVALGYWAADKLDDDNNTWTVTIPPTVAPGNYVLRHERIALHNASGIDGAQNYPNCINLAITGNGADNPVGIPATQFYHDKDPGLLISIFEQHDNYTIPGPLLYQPGLLSPSNATSSVTPSSAIATIAAAASSTTITTSSATTLTSIMTTPVSFSDVLVSQTTEVYNAEPTISFVINPVLTTSPISTSTFVKVADISSEGALGAYSTTTVTVIAC